MLTALASGNHKVRLTAVVGTFNLNWIRLVRKDAGGAVIGGVLKEAEDYSSAIDTTVGNTPGPACGTPTTPNADVDTATSTQTAGYSSDGAEFWVHLSAEDLHNQGDDILKIYASSGTGFLTVRFRDGKGLGLTPEDGAADGNGSPRDGVIQGNTNHVILKVGVCSAGGFDEYWDVWITRPNGQMVHVDKTTCQVAGAITTPVGTFGGDGHTLLTEYYGNVCQLTGLMRLGNVNAGNIFGMKYNKVTVANDWDGSISTKILKLSELRNTAVGSIVLFDDTGGNKVVSNETTMSVTGDPPFFYYVEHEDRSAGVRIMVADDADEPTRGDKVSVKGVLSKDADGNLYVDTRVLGGYCILTSGGQVVAPLSMTNKAAGGKEVTGGAGAENVGLLAIVWGKVSNVVYTGGTGVLTFDLNDGSATPVSVADYAGDGQIAVGDRPVAGEYWKATGILALKLDGSDYKRLLIVDGVNVEEITP